MHDVTRAELSRHTTLRLGGPAGQLIPAIHQDEIVQIMRALAPDQAFLVLAGGSNVVIADAGFAGTVVLLRSTGMAVERLPGGDVLLTVEAGQPWDDVVSFAIAEGLAGIECLSGIPGSAGATPIQNVGAYGQEVADVIASVRVLDREADAVRDLDASECRFSYRSSLFKHNVRFVVLAVTLRLRRAPQSPRSPAARSAPPALAPPAPSPLPPTGSALSSPVRYAELARALGVAPGERAPLAEVRAAVLALRAGKGMVLDPDDPDTFSVGSFFVNPVLTGADFAALRVRAGEIAVGEPSAWPGDDGTVKVSAAWLIERAGYAKGFDGGHPGVAVSGKHTLALTNRGTGTTSSLLALAREIRVGVAKVFDVQLHPEPVLVACTL